jgi:hypothetical protein
MITVKHQSFRWLTVTQVLLWHDARRTLFIMLKNTRELQVNYIPAQRALIYKNTFFEKETKGP